MTTDTTLPSEVDLCIIGGGPAGQTVAALVSKYRPGTRVLVLERQSFPRHRIGEGFIVDINRVLADVGALERVVAEDFPRKWGTTFVWGAERQPCTFLFREAAALVDPPEGYQLEHTWHVDRPRFDEILAEVAQDAGATFVTRQRVVDVLRDGDAVTGVVVRGDDDVERTVRARWVVDAGGAGGPLSTTVGEREFDAAIRNIAVFGYYADLGWRADLNGPPDDRRTVILSHPKGWVWVIPVSREVTGVGFVTDLDNFDRSDGVDRVAWLDRVLGELPEYEALFAGARLVDHRGDGKLVHAMQELSYTCHKVWGPGWVLAGDAAGFVDPVLSIGVYVAMAHAQFLAYALVSVLDGAMDVEQALGAYADSVSDNCGAFRAVAHMFYAYNQTRSDWWRECSRLLRTSVHVPQHADRQAFLAFVTGFTARHVLYEEAVNAFGSDFLVSMGQSLFDGEPLFDEQALVDEHERARGVLAGDPRLRMTMPWSFRPFALPAAGTGRLRPVARLELAGHDADEPGDSVRRIGRRLHVDPALMPLPELLDGTRRVSELADALALRAGEAQVERAAIDHLLGRLALVGALERVGISSPGS